MTQFTRVVNGSTELQAHLFNDLQEAIEQQSFNVMRYGAVGDGVTDDTAAIQAAIDASDTGATGGAGTVLMPPGLYLVSAPLVLPSRTRLIGASGSSEGLYGGTTIKAADGMNDDVITSEDWWHWGEIAHIAIEGNKAGNTSGSGINIGQMGEASTIHNVQVLRCAEDGFKISGESTPSSFIDCSAMANGGYGFNLDGITRHVSLINPSGDTNEEALIYVNGTGAGAISFVNIIGMKAESGGDGSQHEPAVLINNYSGTVNFIGGSIDGYSDNSQLVAVQRQGVNYGGIWFLGLRIARYGTQFDDDSVSGNNIALGTDTHTLNGFVGAGTADISTSGHYLGSGSGTPTASIYGAGTGTGGTPSVAVSGTDIRGTLTITTGTGTSAAGLARLTFAKAFAAVPRMQLTPANAATAGEIAKFYLQHNEATRFEVMAADALTESTVYALDYFVIG